MYAPQQLELFPQEKPHAPSPALVATFLHFRGKPVQPLPELGKLPRKKTLTFRVYADPGHAWAKVPRSFLVALGVTPSPFSYQRGAFVFLEEDADLSAFVRAAEAKGYTIKWRESWTNKQSRIRSYESFHR